jgi:hypothetical protein
MRFFRKVTLISLFCSITPLLFLSQKYICADQQTDYVFQFLWAFGALVGPDHDRRLISIDRDTILKTGDQLKMFLELKENYFAYVFYYSSQGKMYLLFPTNNQFATDYVVDKKYYIPQGSLWFELDEYTGSEIFYLIVSAERLNKLESLYLNYTTSTDAADLKEFAQKILTEIKKTKGQYQKLTTAAERPLRLGGNLRGGINKAVKSSYPSITEIAVEISVTNFYGRTFTIDHR